MWYELRVNRYLCLSQAGPARHVLPGLMRFYSYWVETDCELDDWGERA